LRLRSAALFGSQHRLPVAVLVAEAAPDELYAAGIARKAEITRMEATRQIDSLRRAGLLAASERMSAERVGRPAALFQRTDPVAWAGVLSLGARYRLRPTAVVAPDQPAT
jgi:predicted ArsR family transcriptional regulator